MLKFNDNRQLESTDQGTRSTKADVKLSTCKAATRVTQTGRSAVPILETEADPSSSHRRGGVRAELLPLFNHLLAHDELLHFSGHRQRILVNEPDDRWYLEMCNLVLGR